MSRFPLFIVLSAVLLQAANASDASTPTNAVDGATYRVALDLEGAAKEIGKKIEDSVRKPPEESRTQPVEPSTPTPAAPAPSEAPAPAATGEEAARSSPAPTAPGTGPKAAAPAAPAQSGAPAAPSSSAAVVPRKQVSGIYSSLRYTGSGDLIGEELLVVPARGGGFKAFVQVAAGEAPYTTIVPLTKSGDGYEFVLPSDAPWGLGSQRYSVVFKTGELVLTPDKGKRERLRRGKSYWQ